MADSSKKRKATNESSNGNPKKRKNWQTPKQYNWSKAGKEIQAGYSGIWVTCARGREGTAAVEILDLLEEYGQRLYAGSIGNGAGDGHDSDEDEPLDIEKAISSELSEIKTVKSMRLFTVIRPDVECVIFVKTKSPVNPVELVHTICKDMSEGRAPNRCRMVQRLTPATLTEKAHEKNFEDLATKVLKPFFHGDDSERRTYAIRYSSRNHHLLQRDDVIKKAASLVGDKHKVDLTNPELVILVELYKTICTMAVVDGDYNTLKKYNLAELAAADKGGPSNGPSRLKKPESEKLSKDSIKHEAKNSNDSESTSKVVEDVIKAPSIDTESS